MASTPATPLPDCSPRYNPCQPYPSATPAPGAALCPPPRPSPPRSTDFLSCAPTAGEQDERLPEKKTCPLDDILAELRRPVTVPSECTCPLNWTLTVEYPNQTVLCTSAQKATHPLCTCAQPNGPTITSQNMCSPFPPGYASSENTPPTTPQHACAPQKCAPNFTGNAVPSPRPPSWPCEQIKPNVQQIPCTNFPEKWAPNFTGNTVPSPRPPSWPCEQIKPNVQQIPCSNFPEKCAPNFTGNAVPSPRSPSWSCEQIKPNVQQIPSTNFPEKCAPNFTGNAVPSPRPPSWSCEQIKPNVQQISCTNVPQKYAPNFTGNAVPSPCPPSWQSEQVKPNVAQIPCTNVVQNPTPRREKTWIKETQNSCLQPQGPCTNVMQNPNQQSQTPAINATQTSPQPQGPFTNVMQNPCPQPQSSYNKVMQNPFIHSQRPGTNSVQNSFPQLQSHPTQTTFHQNVSNKLQDMQQQSKNQESTQPHTFSLSEGPKYLPQSTFPQPNRGPLNVRSETNNSFHQLQSSCSLPNWFANAHAGAKSPAQPLQGTGSLCNFTSNSQPFSTPPGKCEQNSFSQPHPEQGMCQPKQCPVHGVYSPCVCSKLTPSACPVHGGPHLPQVPLAPSQASNPGLPFSQPMCPVHGYCRPHIMKPPQTEMPGVAPAQSAGPAPVPAPHLEPCGPCSPPRPNSYTPPSTHTSAYPTACPPGCPAYPLRDILNNSWTSAATRRGLSQPAAPLGSAPPGGGGGGGGGGGDCGRSHPPPASCNVDPGGEDDTVAAALGRGSWVQDEWRPKTRSGPRIVSREGKRAVSRNAADYFKPLHILRGGQLLSDVDNYRLNGIQDSCRIRRL